MNDGACGEGGSVAVRRSCLHPRVPRGPCPYLGDLPSRTAFSFCPNLGPSFCLTGIFALDTDMANDMKEKFRRALDGFRGYPDEKALFLFPDDESEKRVLGYTRQFRQSVRKLFDEKKSLHCVPIRDFRASSEYLTLPSSATLLELSIMEA